ncbi:MAG: hypothetical protein QNK37_18175 [Acidobacteriota bacterium]|nr:hypothetical protein [Acidobacteriota bacterium]
MLLWLACILTAAVFITVLGLENRNIAQRIDDQTEEHLVEKALRVGDLTPPFQALGMDHVPVTVRPGGTPKLLGIVSPSCRACDRQVTHWWPQLISDPRMQSLSPTFVSTASVDDTLTAYGEEVLTGSFLAQPPKAFVRAYRVVKLPLLLLIDEHT